MAYITEKHGRRWPGGRVPFEIADSLSAAEVRFVRTAMAHWESRTLVRFVARDGERRFMRFEHGDRLAENVDGSTDVGRRVWSHSVRFAPGRFDDADAVHEIGHALGFYHEHQRPDRGQFIVVREDRVPRKDRSEVRVERGHMIVTDYDLDSVMHYDSRLTSGPQEWSDGHGFTSVSAYQAARSGVDGHVVFCGSPLGSFEVRPTAHSSIVGDPVEAGTIDARWSCVRRFRAEDHWGEFRFDRVSGGWELRTSRTLADLGTRPPRRGSLGSGPWAAPAISPDEGMEGKPRILFLRLRGSAAPGVQLRQFRATRPRGAPELSDVLVSRPAEDRYTGLAYIGIEVGARPFRSAVLVDWAARVVSVLSLDDDSPASAPLALPDAPTHSAVTEHGEFTGYDAVSGRTWAQQLISDGSAWGDADEVAEGTRGFDEAHLVRAPFDIWVLRRTQGALSTYKLIDSSGVPLVARAWMTPAPGSGIGIAFGGATTLSALDVVGAERLVAGNVHVLRLDTAGRPQSLAAVANHEDRRWSDVGAWGALSGTVVALGDRKAGVVETRRVGAKTLERASATHDVGRWDGSGVVTTEAGSWLVVLSRSRGRSTWIGGGDAAPMIQNGIGKWTHVASFNGADGAFAVLYDADTGAWSSRELVGAGAFGAEIAAGSMGRGARSIAALVSRDRLYLAELRDDKRPVIRPVAARAGGGPIAGAGAAVSVGTQLVQIPGTNLVAGYDFGPGRAFTADLTRSGRLGGATDSARWAGEDFRAVAIAEKPRRAGASEWDVVLVKPA